MPAKNYFRNQLAQGICRAEQAFAVTRRSSGKGRPLGAKLAVRQIAAQHVKACASEAFGHCAQQRRLAIGSRSMSNDQTLGTCGGQRRMQPSGNHFPFKTLYC